MPNPSTYSLSIGYRGKKCILFGLSEVRLWDNVIDWVSLDEVLGGFAQVRLGIVVLLSVSVMGYVAFSVTGVAFGFVAAYISE